MNQFSLFNNKVIILPGFLQRIFFSIDCKHYVFNIPESLDEIGSVDIKQVSGLINSILLDIFLLTSNSIDYEEVTSNESIQGSVLVPVAYRAMKEDIDPDLFRESKNFRKLYEEIDRKPYGYQILKRWLRITETPDESIEIPRWLIRLPIPVRLKLARTDFEKLVTLPASYSNGVSEKLIYDATASIDSYYRQTINVLLMYKWGLIPLDAAAIKSFPIKQIRPPYRFNHLFQVIASTMDKTRADFLFRTFSSNVDIKKVLISNPYIFEKYHGKLIYEREYLYVPSYPALNLNIKNIPESVNPPVIGENDIGYLSIKHFNEASQTLEKIRIISRLYLMRRLPLQDRIQTLSYVPHLWRPLLFDVDELEMVIRSEKVIKSHVLKFMRIAGKTCRVKAEELLSDGDLSNLYLASTAQCSSREIAEAILNNDSSVKLYYNYSDINYEEVEESLQMLRKTLGDKSFVEVFSKANIDFSTWRYALANSDQDCIMNAAIKHLQHQPFSFHRYDMLAYPEELDKMYPFITPREYAPAELKEDFLHMTPAEILVFCSLFVSLNKETLKLLDEYLGSIQYHYDDLVLSVYGHSFNILGRLYKTLKSANSRNVSRTIGYLAFNPNYLRFNSNIRNEILECFFKYSTGGVLRKIYGEDRHCKVIIPSKLSPEFITKFIKWFGKYRADAARVVKFENAEEIKPHIMSYLIVYPELLALV